MPPHPHTEDDVITGSASEDEEHQKWTVPYPEVPHLEKKPHRCFTESSKYS